MRLFFPLAFLIGTLAACQSQSVPTTCKVTGTFTLQPDCTVYTDQFGRMCPVDFSLPIVVAKQDENFLYFISRTPIFGVEVIAGGCGTAIKRRQDSQEGEFYYTEILLHEEFITCATETVYFTAQYLCEGE